MIAHAPPPGTVVRPESAGAALVRRWPDTDRVVMVATDRSQVPPGVDLLEVVAAALAGGAHAVLVRERDLPAQERRMLVAALAALCTRAGAAVLVAGPVPAGVSVSGVHLGRDEPVPDSGPVRPHARPLLGRSCHDLPELLRASRERMDHVTISPVAATASKPGYGPTLGPDGLRELLRALHARHRPVPRVLALGGVDPTNAGRCVEAGADGVAVMGAVMRSCDPAETVRRIVRAVDAAIPPAAWEGAAR